MNGTAPNQPRNRRRWIVFAALVPLALLLLYGLYLFAALHYSYSSGDRVGYVQKFSKRGWVFSTWEGELAMVTMPGSTAEIFPFTVRDAMVAQAINENLGKRVAITYEQHKGLPGFFGDTEYFIVKVRRVTD
jgi:hypothetical protein